MPADDNPEREGAAKEVAGSDDGKAAAQERQRRAELGDELAEVADALEPLWPAYLRDPSTLTSLQQTLLDWHVLSGLVGNGGFDLWVTSNGHRASSTARSLRDHNFEAVAAAVEAAARLAETPEGIDSARSKVKTDRLANVIWDAEDELLQRAVELVRTNRNQFVK